QTLNKLDTQNITDATVVNLTSQLLTQFDQYEAALAGSGAKKLTVDSRGGTGTIVSASGQLVVGDILGSLQDRKHKISSSQRARISDAIATLNQSLGGFGLHLVVTNDGRPADIQLKMAPTSDCGSKSDGVLGCEAGFGQVTLITGWQWYSGADTAA